MRPMTIAVSDEELRIILSILERFLPGLEVRVFGSRITDKVKEFSDLDLVVMTSEPLSTSLLAELKYEFAESDLPFKVDILDWSSLSEEFRTIVNKNYKVIKSINGSDLWK